MILPLLLAVCVPAARAQSGHPTSIEDFVARKARWNELVGATFHLEGRVGTISPTLVQFKRCDLDFELPAGSPALPRDTTVAEVTGTLARRDGHLFFEVTSIRKHDSDRSTLAAMQARINSSDPAEWQSLADWAAGRGAFYQDVELTNKADELRETALMAEYRQLKPDDVDGLLALAARARALKLDDMIAWRLIHDACRIDLARLRRDSRADDAVLQNRIRTELPGSTEPLSAADLTLRSAYDANPDQVYLAADAAGRKKLHRVLYIDVLLAKIERDAKPDGRNGERIADRIEQQLPEMSALAESYRNKEFVFLTARVARLTRDQVLALAGRYNERDRKDEARKVISDWLEEQESGRRLEGPEAQLALADDYLTLLQDSKKAISLAEEAWRSKPDLPGPKDWLEARDLSLHEGRWIPKAEIPPPPESPFAAAIRDGRVVEGMRASQVRQALGTMPTSVVRSASRSNIGELWIFRSSGLAVSLSRSSSETEPIVDEVAPIAR